MKCVRVADWLEQHGEETIGPEWEHLVVHSKSCPDCSLALKERALIFEAIRTIPAPPVPQNLTSQILMAVEATKDAPELTESPVEEWLDRWLTPMQVALTVLCIAVIFGMNLSPHPKADPERIHQLRAATVKPVFKPETKLPVKGESLVRLSDEEVASFMKRLKEYRRLHPEMESPTPLQAQSELVNFEGSR